MRAGVIIVCLSILFAVFLIAEKRFAGTYYVNNDFYDYYVGTKLYWEGKIPFGVSDDFKITVNKYDLDFLWATGYSYPSFLAWIMKPILAIPPKLAANLWMAVNTIIWGLVTYYFGKKSWIKTVYVLTFMPIWWSLGVGQINIILLLPVGMYLYSTGWIKSVGLTIWSLIKVYPLGLLVLEVINKRWKNIIIVLLGLGGVFLVTNYNREYFINFLPSLNNKPHTYFINQSVNGVLSRMFSTIDKSDKVIIPEGALTKLNLLIGGLIMLWLIVGTIKYTGLNWDLIWMGGLSLIAGKNSFANLAVLLFLGLFVIDNWKYLNKSQKLWFYLTVGALNFGWNIVFFWDKWIQINTLWGRTVYVMISSMGFWAILIQTLLVYQISRKGQDKSNCFIRDRI